MKLEKIDSMVKEALLIEAESAKQAGAIGYMAKCLVQASLPYKDPGQETKAWGRENGNFSLVIQPSYVIKGGEAISVGLPYGNLPRLLLAWITTEAVKTKQPTLILGHSLSEFMRQLDLTPTGGRWGSITRIKEQTKRLFSSRISCTYNAEDGFCFEPIEIADKTMLWWDPKHPNQAALWQSIIELNPKFYQAITTKPVPIDMRALKMLKHSPMALDIYCWLTYRMSYLENVSKPIPWGLLQMQFGSTYADSPQGRQGFKRNFKKQLKAVYLAYSQLKIDLNDIGLVLKPSPPHIPQ
jgi:hypothetical protein